MAGIVVPEDPGKENLFQ
ncbi:hypothetical protein VTO73DRAFT_15524 [Trametes versicolor]